MFKKPNNKFFLAISIVLSICLIGVGIVLFTPKKQESKKQENNSKIKVSATFYPLAYLAEQIGQDKVEVTNITPTGVEPHDYEPTSFQIQDVYKSKLLIHLGAGLDPWAEELKSDSLTNLKLSSEFELGKIIDDESETGEEIADPHIWLDPLAMIKAGQKVRDTLVSLDGNNQDSYNRNFENFSQKLKSLDTKFKTELASCKQNKIVTSHNAFQYLAKRYNFQSVSISGISPDSEPSTKDLTDLAKLVKEFGIKYIFTESLVSPELSEILSKETGAKTLVLNPIEGLTQEDVTNKKDWELIMIENLNSLKTALECQ